MSFSHGTTPDPLVSAASAAEPRTSPVEVIRSEEHLVPRVERHVTGAVRFGKRVVTEERTVTITVRREELYLEDVPADGTPADAGTPARDRTAPLDRAEPVATLTLSEEVPEVTLRTVPRETVRLFVDRVTSEQAVTGDVSREVVEHRVVAPDTDRR